MFVRIQGLLCYGVNNCVLFSLYGFHKNGYHAEMPEANLIQKKFGETSTPGPQLTAYMSRFFKNITHSAVLSRPVCY